MDEWGISAEDYVASIRAGAIDPFGRTADELQAELDAVRHGLAARVAAQSGSQSAPINKLPVLHQSVGQSVVVWRRGT